jgi:hypothetical protein
VIVVDCRVYTNIEGCYHSEIEDEDLGDFQNKVWRNCPLTICTSPVVWEWGRFSGLVASGWVKHSSMDTEGWCVGCIEGGQQNETAWTAAYGVRALKMQWH